MENQTAKHFKLRVCPVKEFWRITLWHPGSFKVFKCVLVGVTDSLGFLFFFLHQLVFLWSTTVQLLRILAHGLFYYVLQRLSGNEQPHNVFLLLCQPFPGFVMGDHGHVPAVHLAEVEKALPESETAGIEE